MYRKRDLQEHLWLVVFNTVAVGTVHIPKLGKWTVPTAMGSRTKPGACLSRFTNGPETAKAKQTWLRPRTTNSRLLGPPGFHLQTAQEQSRELRAIADSASGH